MAEHPFPYPALAHEPYVADLAARLRAQGVHPSANAMGVDRREGGACIRCATCDGFPLGALQLIGKVQGVMMKSAAPRGVPLPVLDQLARRSVEWLVMAEACRPPTTA